MEHFFSFWQHLPEHIDPILLRLGPLQIRYYGLMYMTALMVAYGLISYRIKKEKTGFSQETLDGIMTWAILSIILCARLVYVLFYNFSYFKVHPVEIFWPYQEVNGEHYFGLSGLSYHGGLLGVALVISIYCGVNRLNIWKFGDLVSSAVPLGYMFGRIGNFLNGELYGRVTNAPWGMYFPTAPTYELRHPSQLYEALFEGLFLFLIIWPLRQKKFFDGFIFAIYLIGYGIVRFVIEYFREPDAQLGFVFQNLSMGQILCLSMILAGITIIICRKPSFKSAL